MLSVHGTVPMLWPLLEHREVSFEGTHGYIITDEAGMMRRDQRVVEIEDQRRVMRSVICCIFRHF